MLGLLYECQLRNYVGFLNIFSKFQLTKVLNFLGLISFRVMTTDILKQILEPSITWHISVNIKQTLSNLHVRLLALRLSKILSSPSKN